MSEVSVTYGQALYDLAKAEGLEDAILRQLTALVQGLGSEPDFMALLQSYRLTKQERCQVLDDSFRGKLHPYVLNFLKLLTEKGYARHFPDCAEHFHACYREDRGILAVTAVTAVPLSGVQLQRLVRKLESLTGKTVELTNRAEPDVLGGIRLDYDGKRLDGTVAHRLEVVRSLLKRTVL